MAIVPSEFNIRVVCRFRPLSDSEAKAGSVNVAKFPSGADDTVFVSGKVYVYDKVFGPMSTQQTVYSEAAREIVSDVLNGYNGTIFAYGQTSSGKTHTMEGNFDDDTGQGIIPRIVSDIFNHIYSMDSNLQFQIKISYFEIYMDKIRDLLDPTKINLAVHEDKNRVPYVKGCTERFVASPEEVLGAIEEGKANRHIAVTNMNEHSSRSHSVFLIDVKQENVETDKKLTGKLYLVDLAGSEKVSKTGAEGSVLDEAKNINRSLSALGNVIAALADGTKSHVPYRDSKLTRILQESLGGNARTTVIICCSPASYNECETKSTLYFGQRTKMIKNTVIVNEELTAEEWKRRYDREHEKVVKLRGQLAAAERELLRWRNGQVIEKDEMVTLRFAESMAGSLYDDDIDSTLELPSTTMSQQAIQSSAQQRHQTDKQFGRDGNASPFCSAEPTFGRKAGPVRHDGGGESSITDDERVLMFEKECHALYGQLDEKDEEITQLEQQMVLTRDKLSEKEKQFNQQRRVTDSMQIEINGMQQENEKSKDEVKELLAALEELAENYEAKACELNSVNDEMNKMYNQFQKTVADLESVKDDFNNYKECNLFKKRSMSNAFYSIIEDIKELAGLSLTSGLDSTSTTPKNTEGTPITSSSGGGGSGSDGTSTTIASASANDNILTHLLSMSTEDQQGLGSEGCSSTSKDGSVNSMDDDLKEIHMDRQATSCKFVIGKIKIEMKSQVNEIQQLNDQIATINATVDSLKQKLGEYDLLNREQGLNIESLKEEKDKIEVQLRSLRDNQAAASEGGEKSGGSGTENGQQSLESATDMMTKQREEEIVEKQAKLDSLRDKLSALTANYDKVCEEKKEIQAQLEHKNVQLDAYLKKSAQDEHACQQLKMLEDTISKEMQTLYQVRESVVSYMLNKTKKSHVTCADTGEQKSVLSLGSGLDESASKELDKIAPVKTNFNIDSYISDGAIVQRQKVEYLQENLNKLTKLQKDLVRENADLKCEMPKLEKRFKATCERLRILEDALREANEAATRDRKRYAIEVNRIKEAVRSRNFTRKSNHPQIVKPIKAGQMPMFGAVSGNNSGPMVITSNRSPSVMSFDAEKSK